MMTRWTAVTVLALCLAAPAAGAADKHRDDVPRNKQLPAPAQAARPAAPVWRIVPEKSTLAFTATQVGQSFTGRFPKFTAELTLDPADLSSARLIASVDVTAIDAGDKQRNEALPGEDWFDVAAHPKATFKSHKITRKADRSFEATGMLAIKGIERQVTIPFTLTPIGDTAAIKGGFTIRRTDFNVGEGQWSTGQWIGLDVAVAINAAAVKAGSPAP
jgi:polyisoprenoid-binding protein YceI